MALCFEPKKCWQLLTKPEFTDPIVLHEENAEAAAGGLRCGHRDLEGR